MVENHPKILTFSWSKQPPGLGGDVPHAPWLFLATARLGGSCCFLILPFYPMINQHISGKSPCLMGESQLKIAIFNSKRLPEGSFLIQPGCYAIVFFFRCFDDLVCGYSNYPSFTGEPNCHSQLIVDSHGGSSSVSALFSGWGNWELRKSTKILLA